MPFLAKGMPVTTVLDPLPDKVITLDFDAGYLAGNTAHLLEFYFPFQLYIEHKPYYFKYSVTVFRNTSFQIYRSFRICSAAAEISSIEISGIIVSVRIRFSR